MISRIPRIDLQPGYSISRIILGGWQMAGGHGFMDKQQALSTMRAFVEAGITTFDCADIYTGVEELIGEFFQKNREDINSGALPPVQVHTKYVPDLESLPTLTKTYTETIIDRSLKRLGVERLDLVQFHWWDYSIPGYIDTAWHLYELQQAGKIRYIAGTNFDSFHLKEILEAGIPVVSDQVQYSILDHRPETDLRGLMDEYHIQLLCYGTLAGGFLTEKYLGMKNLPREFENRSLTKYRLIIEEFGGFDLFRKSLSVLKQIADTHHVGIAEVAARYILQKPSVSGIIIGVRNVTHLDQIKKIFSFKLSEQDLKKLHSIIKQAQGPFGPVFGLERDRTGKHGRIMKYNLNKNET